MQADVGGVLGKEEKIKSFNQSHSVYFSIVPSLHAAYFSSCGCCRELPKSHQGQGKAPLNPVTINCVRALNGSLKLLIKERNHQFYLMHCPARCPETHHMQGLYKTEPHAPWAKVWGCSFPKHQLWDAESITATGLDQKALPSCSHPISSLGRGKPHTIKGL